MILKIAGGIILASLLMPLVWRLIGFSLGIFFDLITGILTVLREIANLFEPKKKPPETPAGPPGAVKNNDLDKTGWVIILGLIAVMIYYFLIKSGMWYVLLTGKPVS